MKRILFLLCILCTQQIVAQIPEDAVRYSWFRQNASARILSAGGVLGSVGGDISTVFVNPAGLGFYRTSEAVLGLGYGFGKTTAQYRGSGNSYDANNLLLTPTGAIIAFGDKRKPDNSSAVAVAFTQNANFNQTLRYNGLNNFSSLSEQFAEEVVRLNNTGYSLDDILTTTSPAPYGAATALYTYLVDTVRINGNLVVKAAPEYILDAGGALRQEMLKETSGGLYELAFSGATNIEGKWLLGATVGVPILSYKSNTRFTESDTSADVSNHFSSFTYTDDFKTTGAGINLKLGAIYRPKDYVRLGLALHTPSFIAMFDKRRTSLQTALENPGGNYSTDSDLFTDGERGESKYMQTTAWRAILSGSYVFREVEDVTRQKGFISADIEYVNHKGGRFSSQNEEPAEEENAYYKDLNRVVKDLYKGAFNFRVGGELKFNVIMARLGFGYYGNPNRNAPAKSNITTMSGGLGYRNKGFFVDLGYVHNITKDYNVPYRLEFAQNTFATTRQQTGNIVATVGVKF